MKLRQAVEEVAELLQFVLVLVWGGVTGLDRGRVIFRQPVGR
jgi:hypothetical protein